MMVNFDREILCPGLALVDEEDLLSGRMKFRRTIK